MSPPERRAPVIVTGAGTINALGRHVAAFWTLLLRNATGIRAVPDCLGSGSEVLAAPVEDPLPAVTCAGPRLTRTDRLALVATAEALDQSGVRARVPKERIAVVIGTTTGGIREVEDALLARGGSLRGIRRSRLLLFERAATAEAIAGAFELEGPRFTLHTACASGGSAILLGAELIRAGEADAAVVGGSDALARITLSGFRALRLVGGEPCRPFDRNRLGLSLGEGAGVLVLERAEVARARGATVLAKLLSGGESTDAHHLTAPPEDGSGAARALEDALRRAGLTPDEVDHVNAHGTGTVANDASEAAALRSVFGRRAARLPVTSIKGALGHTLGAAGAIEAVAAVWTLRTGLVPPTAGLSDPDPALGLDVARGAPRRGDWKVVLSSSFGFGGANAVLCLARAEA